MATVIATLLVTFLVGVWVGLLCGPGQRHITEAFNKGFVAGCAAAEREGHHP